MSHGSVGDPFARLDMQSKQKGVHFLLVGNVMAHQNGATLSAEQAYGVKEG